MPIQYDSKLLMKHGLKPYRVKFSTVDNSTEEKVQDNPAGKMLLLQSLDFTIDAGVTFQHFKVDGEIIDVVGKDLITGTLNCETFYGGLIPVRNQLALKASVSAAGCGIDVEVFGFILDRVM